MHLHVWPLQGGQHRLILFFLVLYNGGDDDLNKDRYELHYNNK